MCCILRDWQFSAMGFSIPLSPKTLPRVNSCYRNMYVASLFYCFSHSTITKDSSSTLTTPTNKIVVVLICFDILGFSFSYPKTQHLVALAPSMDRE